MGSQSVGTAPSIVPFTSRKRVLISIGILAVLILLEVTIEYLAQSHRHVLLRTLVWFVEMPILMSVLSIHYVWAMKRRLGAVRVLASSAALAGALGLMFGAMFWCLGQHYVFLRFHTERPPVFVRSAALGFAFGLLHCGLWTLAFIFPFAAEDARARALETSRLRTAIELRRLRSNLEPHFLLNTLNAIAGLVTEEPKKARRLIANLGELLSDSLAENDTELHTIGNEIEWLRRYADILQTRYADRLQFDWEIESAALGMLVPRLLLQPLVENAVRHGALGRKSGGVVLIRARVEPGSSPYQLVCTIEDNGPGFVRTSVRRGAYGIDAVRKRLALRDIRSKLRIESSSHGSRITIELPCDEERTHEAPASRVSSESFTHPFESVSANVEP